MADGFQIEIDAELAEQLKGAAIAAGLEPRAYALEILKSALSEDWAEDFRRIEEFERTGESVSVEEAMAHFDEAVRSGQTSSK